MACYDGFGNLADKRPFFTGDFNGDGKSEILFYTPGDKNWWLGTFTGNQLTWTLAGNTAGFGNLADGRPIWAANFAGTGKVDILFYFPGDKNWWLGQFNAANQLTWNLAGNTAGFGQVWDGRPFWIADFNGDGRADVLFHYPGDKNWWLGSFGAGNQLQWSLAGNTAGFGNVADGRPIWAADFTGIGKADILFYFPGDKNWWLGQFNAANQLTWNLAGNTAGFGQVWDGRPFWIADFNGGGKADILFHYPGDKNWWLGSFSGNSLNWTLAGNTAGFGNIADGRPIWAADFAGVGKADILFYFPGDKNWWLGQFNAANQLTWNLAGNTAGFGQVWDGRPFFRADFNGGGKTDVLFYFPGDGNWWLGKFNAANQLTWNLAGNTGRPYRSRVRLHFKVLTAPNVPTNTMLDAMRQVYATANIRVDLISTENLNLPALNDVDIGRCVSGSTTTEQNQLFGNRNNVGVNDVVIYFVRSTVPPSNGCAAHPAGRPGAVVAQGATQWTLAHEVGHVLGLGHVNDNNRLMTGNGTGNITNPPPDLVQSEVQTMDGSNLTITC
jgi:hypothetical protein